jgi:prepilin-type N-terminal cleavage/methylation domain-containing protein
MNAISHRGFTLVELMIVVAIMTIVMTIAIPAYLGYMEEAKLATLRQSLDGMRTFVEDYRLENGAYAAAQWKADGSVKTLDTLYRWVPDGDSGTIDYTLTVNADGTYDVVAVDTLDANAWVRCENRMATCCYPDTDDATVGACPGSS